MATKKEIVADIRQQMGNVLSSKQVGEYLNLCPRATRDYMRDVPCFGIGRKKCYFAIDLANRILEGQLS